MGRYDLPRRSTDAGRSRVARRNRRRGVMALLSRWEMAMWTAIAALVLLLTVLVGRADAHTDAELDSWLNEWSVDAMSALTPELLDELADMRDRHPCYFDLCESRPEVGGGTSRMASEPQDARSSGQEVSSVGAAPTWIVELVQRYFAPGHVAEALTVIRCESRYDPNAANPRSSARGLFQHLEVYWSERSTKAGWEGADIYDPEANVAVAAWLSNGGSSWIHWVCKPT